MSIVLQGSTSGSVTLQEPAVAGTTVLDLPAVSGTILTTGSSGQVIPKAALPTGSVLQVVQTVKTDAFSTTSTSMVDVTGLSVTITPTSATSKILVQLTCCSMGGRTNVVTMYTQIVRGSTFIYDAGNGWGAPANDQPTGLVGTYLDSPATTSATTYKLQIRGDGAIVGINRTASEAGVKGYSSITVMEIAA
jgi:hypothetical protein